MTGLLNPKSPEKKNIIGHFFSDGSRCVSRPWDDFPSGGLLAVLFFSKSVFGRDALTPLEPQNPSPCKSLSSFSSKRVSSCKGVELSDLGISEKNVIHLYRSTRQALTGTIAKDDCCCVTAFVRGICLVVVLHRSVPLFCLHSVQRHHPPFDMGTCTRSHIPLRRKKLRPLLVWGKKWRHTKWTLT